MGHKSDAVHMYKHSNTQLLRNATSKVAAEEPGPSAEFGKPEPFEWDDANYCDKVMSKQEPEIVTLKTVPGVNRAHKNPCRTGDSEGNCTAFCSLLKRIDQKQNERKFKKLKLSLKYRRS